MDIIKNLAVAMLCAVVIGLSIAWGLTDIALLIFGSFGAVVLLSELGRRY